MSENGSTQEKILQAAIDEFSEYGFDGARVARIAKRAGVSQALLYYNYPSKQAILDEIIQEFRAHNINLLAAVHPGEAIRSGNREEFHQRMQQSLDFILKKNKEVNILLMQALLKSQGDKKLLTILADINQEIRAKTLNEYGYTLSSHDQEVNRKVVDFFYLFIPYILFGVLGKEWASENNVDIDEVNRTMLKVGEDIYDEYLK
jgi:AcrR family transcriptional regulator